MRVSCEILDIKHARLDVQRALAAVADPRCGGVDLFVGLVREYNQGREVVSIHYDLFEPLTLAMFEQAAQAALAIEPGLRLYLAHARGQLVVGQIAVIVAAASPHRAEAFAACRQLIEAIKFKAPIWKQEHFADGSSEWSDGSSLRESAAP